MAHEIIATEAMRSLLLKLLTGKQAGLVQLWLGLWVDMPASADGHGTELTSPTYIRQPVNGWVLTEDGLGAETTDIWFHNRGSLRPWPVVRCAFLTDTEAGDKSVLAWAPLREPRILFPGDSLNIPFGVRF